MQSETEFRQEQRGVALGMGTATLVALLSVAGAVWLSPPELFQTLPLADRLAIGVKSGLFAVLWLALAIANVARLRFFSPEDIEGSARPAQSQTLREASAILQNTLEQVTLAVPVYLALAVVLERPLILPVLVGLFSVGRLLFWIGYRRGAAARAFGFALTFYPSIGALIVAAYLTLAA